MNTILMPEFITVAVALFAATVLIGHFLIPLLKSHKIGQTIYKLGPRWHSKKEGTPTMGGICFIISILLVMAVVYIISAIRGDSRQLLPLAFTLSLAVANGMIGFFDDYTKLIKKQNEGFTPKQKLALQIIVAVAYVAAMAFTGNLNTVLSLPYSSISIDLGWVYYVFAIILIVGMVNSTNLTDGIDGLASSLALIVGAFFAIIAFKSVDRSLELVSAALIGATSGFLVYNFHPARVFMGDTGSLFIGGLISGVAFMINKPIIVLIASSVFIFEMISSFLQVLYFKLTHGKRLFKMAPVHHHFEKSGWSEKKIVIVFSLITVVCCTAAWFAV